MRKCELCESPARMYCESDQAILCFDCDARVHGANFLVARHTRALLCDTCQSITPWRVSSARIGRIASVCETCTAGETKDHDEEEGDEEEGENQVVPWTTSEVSLPPPVDESCSSSSEEETEEEEDGKERDHKRSREDDRCRSFFSTGSITARERSTCLYGSGSRSGYTRQRRG